MSDQLPRHESVRVNDIEYECVSAMLDIIFFVIHLWLGILSELFCAELN